MKKTAIVTCDMFPELIDAERDLPVILKQYEIDAEPVIWDDKDVQWNKYDNIIVRTPWDYYNKIDNFYSWLDIIDETGIPMDNNSTIIKWNLHKYYLRDLAEKGVLIVPTVFLNKETEHDLEYIIKDKGWEKAIIKPAISAAAYETHIISEENIRFGQDKLNELLKSGDMLVQLYFENIVTDGEWSFIYFKGKYSHAIRKLPKDGDFRVQKWWGGNYYYGEPDNSIKSQADKIISIEGKDLLYARVDGIVYDSKLHLMELELTEPELFLEHSKEAKENFIQAIINNK
jgi:hypothetical protein